MTTPEASELLLFEEPSAESGSCLVLASSWSVGALFARGCLLAPCWGEPTRLAVLDDGWP